MMVRVNLLYVVFLLVGAALGALVMRLRARRRGETAAPAINPAMQEVLVRLLHPISLLAGFLIIAVVILIGANLFGFDQGGVLTNLATGGYARGLITYLFAVGTIGVIVMLMLSALLGWSKGEDFDRAKDVLTVLIGIFGTIIGFYFGSVKAEEDAGTVPLTFASAEIDNDTLAAAGPFGVRAAAAYGTPPYRFTLALGADPPVPADSAGADGHMASDLVAPEVPRDTTIVLVLRLEDAAGAVAERPFRLVIRP